MSGWIAPLHVFGTVLVALACAAAAARALRTASGESGAGAFGFGAVVGLVGAARFDFTAAPPPAGVEFPAAAGLTVEPDTAALAAPIGITNAARTATTKAETANSRRHADLRYERMDKPPELTLKPPL